MGLLVICGCFASAATIQQSFDNIDDIVLLDDVVQDDIQLAFNDLYEVEAIKLSKDTLYADVLRLESFVFYGGFYTEFEPNTVVIKKRFPLARSAVTYTQGAT